MGVQQPESRCKNAPWKTRCYVRNPEAHGLVSSSALSIWDYTVNFCCSAHSPQLLKGPVCDFKFKNLKFKNLRYVTLIQMVACGSRIIDMLR